MIAAGVDWSREADILALWAPLVDDGRAPVLQLTVEQAFAPSLPEAWTSRLDVAAARGDLLGHAVYGAPFSMPRDTMTRDWLARTRAVLDRWPVRWLTDHVGCSRADGWNAAPVPLPASRELAVHVAEHLRWVRDALEVPVGLENLALAVSAEDVRAQPDLVEAMLEPVDGVLLLDLHNLWCQAVNFDLDPLDLLQRWPLDRVRQVHVAGGRWAEPPGGRMRRDTHDGPVPEAVFALLPEALALCANLEVVVLERMGGSVGGHALAVREEYQRLCDMLEVPRPPVRSLERRSTRPLPPGDPLVQHGIVRALRHDDRAALEALIPGWWADERAWHTAVELTARWGFAVEG